MPKPRGLNLWRRLALLGASGILVASYSIAYVTLREQDNTFCISCHAPGGGGWLHGAKYDRTVGKGAGTRDLTTLHYRELVKCIDCHGGVGAIDRARILSVAAIDSLRYLADRYEEPTRLRAALWDRDCTWCHRGFTVVYAEEDVARQRKYHAHPSHLNVPVACIACHTSHEPADPKLQYLRAELVRPQCRRCHPDLFGADVAR